MFEGAEARSLNFAAHYRQVAALARTAPSWTPATVIRSSDLDGIHFEAGEHAKLGAAVAEQVRALVDAA